MTRQFIIPAIGLFVAACSTQSVPTENKDREFFVIEVGAYSDMKLPEFMRAHYPTRFNHSIEPSFFDTVGSEMENVEIEDFCKRQSTDMLIVSDCKLINEESLHVEFYLSQYNPYNGDYAFIGKYALFKTPSIAYPALLIDMPLNGPTTDNKEMIEGYFISESKAPADPQKAKLFEDFVRSIKFEDFENPEPEWLTFEDKEKGFRINYPNGFFPRPYDEDSVFSLGNDGQFLVNFYATRANLEESINSSWDHFENRTVIWSQDKVGEYDAEKVTIDTGRGSKYETYVVKAQNGYFTLRYDENYFKGFNNVLHTFQLLE